MALNQRLQSLDIQTAKNASAASPAFALQIVLQMDAGKTSDLGGFVFSASTHNSVFFGCGSVMLNYSNLHFAGLQMKDQICASTLSGLCELLKSIVLNAMKNLDETYFWSHVTAATLINPQHNV